MIITKSFIGRVTTDGTIEYGGNYTWNASPREKYVMGSAWSKISFGSEENGLRGQGAFSNEKPLEEKEFVPAPETIIIAVSESGAKEEFALVPAVSLAAVAYASNDDSGLMADILQWAQKLVPSEMPAKNAAAVKEMAVRN